MDYFKTKEALLSSVKNLAGLVKENLSEQTEELDYFKHELENINFNVLCLGDFSSGKTTFINNFFLEEKVKLPTRATTTTAKLTVIKYGKELKILAIMKDGSNIEIKENIEDSLKELVAAKGDKLDEVEFVEIQLPSSILKEGVVIVDSPGLNDPEAERMEVTFRFVNQADCVLYFLNASQAWKKSEKEFLEEKILRKDDLDKIFFLLNYWDVIEDEEDREEIIEYVSDAIKKSITIAKNKLQTDVNIPPLIPISSKTGEGFNKLKDVLFSYLTGKKAQDILNSKINKYNSYIDSYIEIINEKEKLIKENNQEILKKEEKIKAELKEYESKAEEIKNKIIKSISNKYAEFVDNLQYAFSSIISDFDTSLAIHVIETPEDFKKVMTLCLKKAELKADALIISSTSKFKREILEIVNREKSSLLIPYNKMLDSDFLEAKLLQVNINYHDNMQLAKNLALGTSVFSIIGAGGAGISAATATTTIAGTPGAIASIWSFFVGNSATQVAGASISTILGISAIPLALFGGVIFVTLKKRSKDKFQQALQNAKAESSLNLQSMYNEKIKYMRFKEDEISEIIANNINHEFIKAYKDKLKEYEQIKEIKDSGESFDDLKQKLIVLKLT